MGLFGRRRLVDPSMVIEDSTGDDALEAAFAAVDDADAPVADRIDAALAHLATVRPDPERHVVAATVLAGPLLTELDELRARVAAVRTGPDAAELRGLLAGALNATAWELRGGGWAKNVAPDVWNPFRQLLEEADEVGYAALEQVPDHAPAGIARMMTGLGLGLSTEEWWHRFDVARRSRPTLYPAHWFMLSALCAKWYGSDEQMWQFGRATAEQAPPGDPVTAMLALAHYEQVISLKRQELPAREVTRLWTAGIRRDLPALTAAADRWLQGPAAAHPRDFEAHQLFGFVFHSGGEDDLARRHLELGTLRIAMVPWRDAEHFAETLSDLKVVPAG